MEDKERTLLVSRIISGTYIFEYANSLYTLKYSSSIERYKAQLLYEKSLREVSFSEFYTQEQALDILAQKGLWDYKYEEVLEKYAKDIEALKVKLYESFFNEEKANVIRSVLEQIRTDQRRILSIKDSLNYVTDIGYASMVKAQYLTACCLFKEDGSRVFDPNNLKQKTSLLDKLMMNINANKIGPDKIRELARTEPWKSIWSVSKNINPFGKPTADWTEDQKMLAMFSGMYDGISQHPDCPATEVVQDDDCIDGWLILERRKSEKRKTQKKVEGMLDNHPNATEVFFTAKDNKDAAKINDLNDIRGKMIKRQRRIYIEKNKGRAVYESELPDIRQEIVMQANREMAQSVK